MEMQEKKALLFSNKDLKKLIWPLIIEQLLTVTVGMMDTVMIASVGESAVSAVSLVDSIMILIIQIFAAIATGGAVVAGQFLGAKDEDCACQSANQLVLFISVLSVAVMGLVYLLRGFILHQVFGKITAEVMAHSSTYLDIVSLSIPFIALYNGGAALFRTMGNSRVSMYTSLLMNGINITGNAIMIYGLHMGVAGAAIPTLVSRIVAAVVMIVLLLNPKQLVHLKRPFSLKFDATLIKRILYIGVPNGLENSMFQLGKILLLSLVSGFGTAAIAANAVSNTLATFMTLPGMAIGFAIITVVSRCIGAGDYKQARYYTRKLIKITYLALLLTNALIILGLPAVLSLYHLSDITASMTTQIIFSYAAAAIVIWAPAFSLPNTLRAANDVKFSMVVSILSMWIFRIGFSFLLAKNMGLGVFGVWISMYIDWLVRSILFVLRYKGVSWYRYTGC
ncbi:MAG: MATE family efflux transporter [Christensenellales bacterium]